MRLRWKGRRREKNRHGAITLGGVVTLMALCASAQQPPSAQTVRDLPVGVTALGPVTTERSDRYRFESQVVGKPFIIEVVRIDALFSPPAPGDRLPIIFVTDNDLLSMLVPTIARVGSMELFPSMIVVGVGYDLSDAADPVDAFVLGAARRATDFTPTFDEAYLAGVVPFTEQVLGRSWPEDASLGGADAFLAFIDEELKPFVAAHYPVDLEDGTLIGHSLGGLFALHVLFTSPDSFKRYVALSPAAQYGDGILFREEAALPDAPARVFIGLGSEDSPEILEATPRLHAQIEARARPGLRYSYKLFPGETHASVLPTGLMSGLRAVLDPPSLPAFAPPEEAQP